MNQETRNVSQPLIFNLIMSTVSYSCSFKKYWEQRRNQIFNGIKYLVPRRLETSHYWCLDFVLMTSIRPLNHDHGRVMSD